MGYISAITKEDKVLVWERVNGKRILKKYAAPFYFYVPDSTGKYKGLYGESLTKIECTNRKTYNVLKQKYSAIHYEQYNKQALYEADLAPELKVLSQAYHDVPVPDLHITFYDIEVDYDPAKGHASINNPYAPVNAVALYHRHTRQYVVVAVPPPTRRDVDVDDLVVEMNKIEKLPDNIDIVLCKNERELLLVFLSEIDDSDVVLGWNSTFFDSPYITKRIGLTLGDAYVQKLSFPEANKPRFREVEKFKRIQQIVDWSGRTNSDYLDLFRKYEQYERPSYKLEAIAEELLPDMPKLSYKGTLAQLYRDNFAKFVRYNIRDTEILEGFEQKLGYVALANEMYHLSLGLFSQVTGTVKLTELAIVNYCHHELNLIVPDAEPDRKDGHIRGAYVLFPQRGLHTMVGSIDLTSLYPATIRSLNISPEKIIGQFDEEGVASVEISKQSFVSLNLTYEDGTTEEHTADDWWNILWDRKWAISGHGTVFNQDKQGIIPAILTSWFIKRKYFQKLAAEAELTNDTDKATYYDRLQYIYKIKLNSAYGALSNYTFRFFDLRMGESTTGSARMVLQHQARMVSLTLDGTYDVDFPLYEDIKDAEKSGHPPETALNGPSFDGKFTCDSVITGDTDSCYFKTHADTVEEAVIVADYVARKVNASFQDFVIKTFRCQPEFDNLNSTKREIVSDRGIFVDKKRYILHLVNKEGTPCDKMKTMGLELKKTTLPAPIKKRLSSYIERFLKDEQWNIIADDIIDYIEYLKHTVPDEDVIELGLPKGANNVEHYMNEYQTLGMAARLPGHIAAVIHYNQCLSQFEDSENPVIMSGAKIRVFYLKRKMGKFKSIALPTDTEDLPIWFMEHYVPLIDKEAQIERLIRGPLDNILSAVGISVPEKQDRITNDLLSF